MKLTDNELLSIEWGEKHSKIIKDITKIFSDSSLPRSRICSILAGVIVRDAELSFPNNYEYESVAEKAARRIIRVSEFLIKEES